MCLESDLFTILVLVVFGMYHEKVKKYNLQCILMIAAHIICVIQCITHIYYYYYLFLNMCNKSVLTDKIKTWSVQHLSTIFMYFNQGFQTGKDYK